MRVVMLKDIRPFSLENLQVSDNLMYILNNVDDYNALKLIFPGKSCRQLATGILFYF